MRRCANPGSVAEATPAASPAAAPDRAPAREKHEVEREAPELLERHLHLLSILAQHQHVAPHMYPGIHELAAVLPLPCSSSSWLWKSVTVPCALPTREQATNRAGRAHASLWQVAELHAVNGGQVWAHSPRSVVDKGAFRWVTLPPTHTTNSPRARAGRNAPAVRRGCLNGPSCSLLNSRLTLAGAVRAEDIGQFTQQLHASGTAFVQDDRARLIAQGLNGGAPLLLRQEAFEHEAFAGQTAHHQRGHEGRGTRQALHAMPASTAARTSRKPGSLMPGCRRR